MIVYGDVVLSGRLGAAATAWLPFSSAFVAGVLATIAKLWVPELNLVLVILSAVAIILPGHTISLGAMELVAQHVLSGTANLTSGSATHLSDRNPAYETHTERLPNPSNYYPVDQLVTPRRAWPRRA